MPSRRTRATACALVLASAGLLGACGGGGTAAPQPSGSVTVQHRAADPTAGLLGPGCATMVKRLGATSPAKLARTPAVTALGELPGTARWLGLLTGGLNRQADLTSSLSGQGLTFIVPNDAAVEAIPRHTLKAIGRDADASFRLLSYHLLATPLAPAALVDGEQPTFQGAAVTVTGSGDTLRLGGAGVVCGGIRTADAVIYVVDGVLAPPEPQF